MPFINSIQTIIRKSNKNILKFYVKDEILFFKEFVYKSGWKDEVKLLENIDCHSLNIKIDDKDKIYGVVAKKNGDILYFYTDKDNTIRSKKLFLYDTKKYNVIYPYIKKIDDTLHIIYYLKNIKDNNIWSLFSHYFDGEKWYENNIDFVVAHPFIYPFTVSYLFDDLTIFYFNKRDGNEEIFVSQFNPLEKIWSSPIQITNTKNKKMYLSILQDNKNLFHITWSEFIEENLIIMYTNGSIIDNSFNLSPILHLSEPSNCSYPTLIKVGKSLCNMWIQLDKLYSCYSIDNRNIWTEPIIDSKSYENDFIRYKFSSNYIEDLNNFKLDNIFGVYSPKISFIGFENI